MRPSRFVVLASLAFLAVTGTSEGACMDSELVVHAVGTINAIDVR